MFPIQSNTEDTSKLYVDDVFSTYLYTGNGSTQTINNGIDLAGKGGLVWTKTRGVAYAHNLYSTALGTGKHLSSDSPIGVVTDAATITAFNSNGFSVGADDNVQYASGPGVSWTFRKAPKFFDVVTFTTDSSGNATVSHSLGTTPGMVITKATATTSAWLSWHTGLISTNYYVALNTTAAQANFGSQWINPSASNIVFQNGALLASQSYVAYLFAHDPSVDGIIQCGSYIGNGGAVQDINLGWEPQYVLVKNASAAADWWITDAMRGFTTVGVNSPALYANQSAAETTQSLWNANATGFTIGAFNNVQGNANGNTYIYLAIRRPNKPPTTGTQVFNAVARTGTGAATTSTAGFPVDLVITKKRSSTTLTGSQWVDRLRGKTITLDSTATTAESTVAQSITAMDSMATVSIGTDGSYNTSTYTYVDWFFRRYPGVFDEVCYTGTGTVTTVAHNLGVAPELMIVKHRSGTGDSGDWNVYCVAVGNNAALRVNSTGTTIGGYWNSTSPTASVFSLGNGNCNVSAVTYVAYLFSTKAGISKVGSYTGNGGTQTINCGFSTGARFILIKRTDNTGDWFVWDSVRGIVSGNDPHLSLNSTAAEVTTDDSIDPDTSGFIVNQVAATNINVNTATYIYLALT